MDEDPGSRPYFSNCDVAKPNMLHHKLSTSLPLGRES